MEHLRGHVLSESHPDLLAATAQVGLHQISMVLQRVDVLMRLARLQVLEHLELEFLAVGEVDQVFCLFATGFFCGKLALTFQSELLLSCFLLGFPFLHDCPLLLHSFKILSHIDLRFFLDDLFLLEVCKQLLLILWRQLREVRPLALQVEIGHFLLGAL